MPETWFSSETTTVHFDVPGKTSVFGKKSVTFSGYSLTSKTPLHLYCGGNYDLIDLADLMRNKGDINVGCKFYSHYDTHQYTNLKINDREHIDPALDFLVEHGFSKELAKKIKVEAKEYFAGFEIAAEHDEYERQREFGFAKGKRSKKPTTRGRQ